MADQRTRTGLVVAVTPTAASDHAELHRLFADVVAAGEGYPQDPSVPVTWEEFERFWLAPATVTVVARVAGELAGAYTLKPNGVGRAAHVANVGYVVAAPHRGQGVGELLVRHSLDEARARGFDAMQFNVVFESNPARRLYERLGFEQVGRIPDVIDGEAVCVYWRRLAESTPPFERHHW